jgi:hypothetical protein
VIAFNGTSIFCCITYANGKGFNTSATSLFGAAAAAIEWAEVSCRKFGTARILPDGEILTISVGAGASDRSYRVRVGRVREWLAGRSE